MPPASFAPGWSLLQLFIAVAALAQAPPAIAPGAPSDEPAPSEASRPSATVDAAAEADKPVRLGGFDFGLTVFNSSGTYFGAKGYSNTFTFWFEPAFAVGKRLFKGTWFERLGISARIPVEVEVVGSDPRFRGSNFRTSNLINAPESLPILAAQKPGSGLVDGSEHRPVELGDIWLTVAHGKLFTVPGLGIDVATSLRTVLPSSVASRSSGLIASLGLGVIFERKFKERVTLGYVIRPTKYFYSRTQGGIAALSTPVTINGRTEQTYTLAGTGIANPTFGFINGFWAEILLPRGFQISLTYFLFNTKPYDLVGGCDAAGVGLSNTCTDGALVGDVRKSPWRNEHWFLGSVDYTHSFWELSLGISTFRPLNNPDGSLSQPFYESNRNNYTTVYLSFSAKAEEIAQYVAGEKRP